MIKMALNKVIGGCSLFPVFCKKTLSNAIL